MACGISSPKETRRNRSLLPGWQIRSPLLLSSEAQLSGENCRMCLIEMGMPRLGPNRKPETERTVNRLSTGSRVLKFPVRRYRGWNWVSERIHRWSVNAGTA